MIKKINLFSFLFVTLANVFASTNIKTTVKKPLKKYSKPHTISTRKKNTKDLVLSLSIPKCGTHLLLKCLTLFSIEGLVYNYNHSLKPSENQLEKIRALNKKSPPLHYKGMFDIPRVGPLPKGTIRRMETLKNRKLFWSHWPYTPEFARYLNNHTRANFLIIRDPRDMVVSFALMILKGDNGKVADFHKLIVDLITGKQEYYIPWAVEIQEAYPILWEKGLYNFYQLYTPWMQAKNFHLVRFEHLVGPQGGGNAELQIQEIMNIGQHLGLEMTRQKTLDVIKDLFGGTWTFREGQIGGWKKYFTPEIKALFKGDTRLVQLLIDLGYEKDATW